MSSSLTIGSILIIDDESINSDTMKDTLEDVNYQVVLAKDAEQAKVIVEDQTFDLVMMDVWMPGQDGMSLLEEWMAEDFSMPVVMMSGHAEHQDVVKAIKLGAVDFLKKPLHDLFTIKRIVVSTYQSVSGGGKAPMDELLSQTKEYLDNKKVHSKYFTKQIAFNAIPHIDN